MTKTHVVTTKVFWKSKTFWVGVLQLLGGLATALAGELQTAGALSASGVATIVLRLVTEQGVSLK